jgi:catechol-2,3-dioxygenase
MKIFAATLKTHQLDSLREFYADKLGFMLLEDDDDGFTLDAGASRLRFERDESAEFRYHFAFNIPPDQFLEAQVWLAQRVEFLRESSGECVIQHGGKWNAEALYFADPAGNIVEFIARYALNHTTEIPFSAQSVLCLSEVGLVVANAQTMLHHLQGSVQHPFPPYDNGSDAFQAVGDEHGLLILAKEGRIWYPTRTAATVAPLDLTLLGAAQETVILDEYPYHIRIVAP